ncbi:MMPL family transporter [Rothia sp. ZJ1223]|uniref:MMPL family transporter n=1 Tax=Rothia sp. ZJ1223 TaxID=2811098 RepID=UPI00195AF789|nr:MMPL family transporter [Rothia sp. ZJ1223]
MEHLLARIGSASARRAKTVLAVWLVVLAVAGVLALTIARGATSNYTIPGADFQRVTDQLHAALPETGESSGLVALRTEGAVFTEQQKQDFAAVRSEIEALETVASVSDPFVTQAQLDEQRAQVEGAPAQISDAQRQIDEGRIAVDQAREDLPDVPDAVLDTIAPGALDEINDRSAELDTAQSQVDGQRASLEPAQRALELAGDTRTVSEDNTVALVNVTLSEDIYSMNADDREQILEAFEALETSQLEVNFSNELVQDVSEVFGASEAIGLMVAMVVLLVTLASVVAAGLPLVVALIGCGIGVGLVYASTSFVSMTATDPVLALMLGLGVGIDYALLILHRFREARVEGRAKVEAIAEANATAGHAVLFAGMTNIIALGALSVTGVPFLAVMGFAGSFAVAVVIAVALTLTPALLSLLDTKLLSAQQRQMLASGRTAEESRSLKLERANRGWGAFVTRHPWLMTFASLSVLALAIIPAGSLRLGLPDGSYQQADSTAFKTYDAVKEHFGEGRNGSIAAVVHDDSATDSEAMRAVATDVAENLKIEGITSASVSAISEDSHTALVTLIPTEGPNSESTVNTVHKLSEHAEKLETERDLQVGLTGQTVANIEISERIMAAIPVYLSVVVALSLLLMGFVFRSVLIPLMATVGFLMSTLASFGAVVAVYQWGWGADIFGVAQPGPILAFLPILLVGILFGLSVDYQIFIVSGMQDARRAGFTAREAVRVGYRTGGAVVTACGVIMISVFAGFVFSHLTVVRPIGFALALGVAMDAFLVRTTFIPATMHLLGEKAWWLPGRKK